MRRGSGWSFRSHTPVGCRLPETLPARAFRLARLLETGGDGAPSGLSLAHIDVRGKAVLSNAPLAEVVQVLLWAGGGAARSVHGRRTGATRERRGLWLQLG